LPEIVDLPEPKRDNVNITDIADLASEATESKAANVSCCS